VLGDVWQQRVYAISEGLTLIRLLSQAGGFNESTARRRHVVITREINDTETKLMIFDVRKNMKAGTDMLLEPGDIIYMPRKKLVNLNDFIQRVTAPASSAMNFAQQVMGLYNSAYNTYYTKERFERLYGNNGQDSATATVERALIDVLSLQSTVQSSMQQLVPGAQQAGTP
jgi:ribosomal protein L16 Arg81 hydroxylase